LYFVSYEKFISAERTTGEQAGYQIAAIVVTLGIAILGGALIGLLMKIPIWDNLESKELYEDEVFWIVSLDMYSSW